MPSEVIPVGVGIIGPVRSVHYTRERISLRHEFVSVATHATGGEHWTPSERDDCVARSTHHEVIEDSRVKLVYFSGSVSGQWIASAIQAKKHVVLESPPALSGDELRGLAEFALANGVIATLHQPRYWAEDFLCAWDVVQNRKTGRLLRIRLAVHERLIPGDVFPRGVLRDVGFHLFDQLFMLVDDELSSVSLRPFPDSSLQTEDGFLAAIDFVGGASAVIEIQIRSLLSLRTGWMIEGMEGAYRSGRYYSKTTDGEIIDEPVTKLDISADPFLDALSVAIRGTASGVPVLQGLKHAGRVMDLIDTLERSIR